MEINIELKLGGEGFPDIDELDLRNTLEDLIEERGIGEVVGAGGGMGIMELQVEVEKPRQALKAIKALVVELKLDPFTTCSVVKPPKRKVVACPINAGDCLAIPLSDGDYGAALVLATSEGYYGDWDMLVGLLEYKHGTKPKLDVFEQRKWLVLTHHQWKGVREITWCSTYDYRDVAHLIEVVGRSELRPDDPTTSNSYSPWNGVVNQVVWQYSWDAGERS